MDSKELHGLYEAYNEVYAPQEIDEGLRSAVKRLLGGGKKEAEAPKPESRGEQLRKKYNVGPEKSDTSAKRQILDRSRAKAEKDEKEFGGSKYSKSVAQKSKAAHDSYLKAGYSKYGADDARGSGNRARKRASALNKEEFEFVVNALIEEGYDLSSYTWDEMYDICLDEAVKGESGERRKDLAAERRSGIKPLSAKEGQKYASHKLSQMSYVKRQRMGEEVEGLEESGLSQNTIRSAAKERLRRVDAAYAKDTPQGDAEGNAGMKKLARTKAQLNINKPREVRMRANEEFDIFDAILEYLVTEGYADTNESALVIMANMSEDWRGDIMEISDRKVAAVGRRRQANVDKAMSSDKYISDKPGATQKLATAISKKNRFNYLNKKRERMGQLSDKFAKQRRGEA